MMRDSDVMTESGHGFLVPREKEVPSAAPRWLLLKIKHLFEFLGGVRDTPCAVDRIIEEL